MKIQSMLKVIFLMSAIYHQSTRYVYYDDSLFLFYDLLSAPMFHHSVWSVITAHNRTPAKRDVTTVVSDQRSRFNRVSTINDYNTPDTVVKHTYRRRN